MPKFFCQRGMIKRIYRTFFWLHVFCLLVIGDVHAQEADTARVTTAIENPPDEKLPAGPTDDVLLPQGAAQITAGENGFSIRSVENDFLLRIRGDIHADGRFFVNGDLPDGAESFFIRRVRLNVQGTIYDRFVFRIMPNFGMGRAELHDAYIEARFAPFFGVRMGKFKTPVGLEFLQSPNSMFFAERAYPATLVPNRDAGILLHGSVLGQRLDYAAGVFNGTVDGGSVDADLDDSKDFVVRLFARVLEGSGLGLAATAGRREGNTAQANLAAYRTSGRQTFFQYRGGTGGVYADGQSVRLVPQGYYFTGPLGFIAEYALSRQDVATDTDAATLTHRAWQVAGGYVLTGERSSYDGLRPDRPWNREQGYLGAFELVGRVHALKLDEAAFPTFAEIDRAALSAVTWGVGLNWYLNAGTRFMINYEQTRFEASGAAEKRESEHLLLTRFQLAF